MDIAGLFLRAINNRGNAYLPYYFEGDWSENEMDIVAKALDHNVPNSVDAKFNRWRFTKSSKTFFMARRAKWEWDSILDARSAKELSDKVEHYYSR